MWNPRALYRLAVQPDYLFGVDLDMAFAGREFAAWRELLHTYVEEWRQAALTALLNADGRFGFTDRDVRRAVKQALADLAKAPRWDRDPSDTLRASRHNFNGLLAAAVRQGIEVDEATLWTLAIHWTVWRRYLSEHPEAPRRPIGHRFAAKLPAELLRDDELAQRLLESWPIGAIGAPAETPMHPRARRELADQIAAGMPELTGRDADLEELQRAVVLMLRGEPLPWPVLRKVRWYRLSRSAYEPVLAPFDLSGHVRDHNGVYHLLVDAPASAVGAAVEAVVAERFGFGPAEARVIAVLAMRAASPSTSELMWPRLAELRTENPGALYQLARLPEQAFGVEDITEVLAGLPRAWRERAHAYLAELREAALAVPSLELPAPVVVTATRRALAELKAVVKGVSVERPRAPGKVVGPEVGQLAPTLARVAVRQGVELAEDDLLDAAVRWYVWDAASRDRPALQALLGSTFLFGLDPGLLADAELRRELWRRGWPVGLANRIDFITTTPLSVPVGDLLREALPLLAGALREPERAERDELEQLNVHSLPLGLRILPEHELARFARTELGEALAGALDALVVFSLPSADGTGSVVLSERWLDRLVLLSASPATPLAVRLSWLPRALEHLRMDVLGGPAVLPGSTHAVPTTLPKPTPPCPVSCAPSCRRAGSRTRFRCSPRRHSTRRTTSCCARRCRCSPI